MYKGGGCRWSSSVSGLRPKKTKDRNKKETETKRKQKQKGIKTETKTENRFILIFSNQFYSWSSNAWMSLNEVKASFGQQDEGRK
jgi:hypothetical protein